MRGHDSYVWSLSFFPDGKQLASASDDGTIKLWDLVEGKEASSVFAGKTKQVWSLCCSPDGKYLVSGSDEDKIIIWNAKKGEEVKDPEGTRQYC